MASEDPADGARWQAEVDGDLIATLPLFVLWNPPLAVAAGPRVARRFGQRSTPDEGHLGIDKIRPGRQPPRCPHPEDPTGRPVPARKRTDPPRVLAVRRSAHPLAKAALGAGVRSVVPTTWKRSVVEVALVARRPVRKRAPDTPEAIRRGSPQFTSRQDVEVLEVVPGRYEDAFFRLHRRRH